MTEQPPVRFDDLGSLQFEQFCGELIGLDRAVDADALPWGFSLVRREGVELPSGGRLNGPTLVLVVWLRAGSSSTEAARRLARIVEHAVTACEPPPRSLLVLTNVSAATPPPMLEMVVLGPTELSELLLAWPEIRFRLPFLLGVTDPSLLVADDIARRSSADIGAAAALARVFVPTRAYVHALGVLRQHHFVVLTGPPEMGKTAIARVLGLAALTDGWELHECLRPDELWRHFDRDRRQLFIADDAFGSTEYRPETAERWALELNRVLHALDEHHWLIWTSRPAPLKAALRQIHREHGVERFPQPAEVGVDSAALDITEKALILFRHTKDARVSDAATALVRAHGWQIVAHPHFTPERIRRFVAGRLRQLAEDEHADIAAAVAAEIREPTSAMAASYRALAPDHRAVLLALLDTAPGPVNERELTTVLRRHSTGGLAHPINAIVDRLADHFLRLGPAGVTWVHPSWRDLVIDELAADDRARRDFLSTCSIHGLALALSTAGGSTGERMLPLLRRDADWDAIAGRLAELIPELQAPETTLILGTLSEATAQADDAVRAEVDALAAATLARLARGWHGADTPVPVGLLSAWLDLAAALAEPPSPPVAAIAATWIELLPPEEPDLAAAGQLVALDDWLTLAELLDSRAPDILARFDFPDAHAATLLAIVDAAAGFTPAAADHPAGRGLLVDVLHRVGRLAPALAAEASAAAAALTESTLPAAPEPEAPLRELSPETERLLQRPLRSARNDHVIIGRVLRDL